VTNLYKPTPNAPTQERFSIFAQRKLNGPDDPVNVVHDLVVPKADDFVPQLLQMPGTLHVVTFLLQMLAPVEFDYQFLLDGAKIDDACTEPAEV